MADGATADRTLPHNLEAERSVLGAILMRNDAIDEASQIIDTQDFFREAHRVIWDAMIALNDRGEGIDLVTLKDTLARGGRLEDVGGASYVAALSDGVPRSMNVEGFARIVKEKATLRSLILSANRILVDAYDAEQDADVLLDEAERSIFQIADQRINTGFVPLHEALKESFETLQSLQEHRGAVTGVPTGFTELDEMTAGFQQGDLVIVAARPSMGKTSFTLNIAQHVGKEGHTVGFFSLEMSRQQLVARMLTSEARIDAQKFRRGSLTEADYGRLALAVGTLSDAKVFIDDTAAIGVLEMRAKARRLKAKHGLALLVIDYIQLMQGRGRFDNRQQELASISRSLKQLAKELQVPIVALSQLSRAPDARADKRPQLSDLRESGALEQDADVVLFIYREEQYTREETDPELEGIAEIIVGKQRNGPTGTVKLVFVKQFTRFENYEWRGQ